LTDKRIYRHADLPPSGKSAKIDMYQMHPTADFTYTDAGGQRTAA